MLLSILRELVLANVTMIYIFNLLCASLWNWCYNERYTNSDPGHDRITLHMLNLSLSAIKAPPIDIFNLTVSEAIFPSELKTASVAPLFKADDQLNRPASPLCVLSKVLENVTYSR